MKCPLPETIRKATYCLFGWFANKIRELCGLALINALLALPSALLCLGLLSDDTIYGTNIFSSFYFVILTKCIPFPPNEQYDVTSDRWLITFLGNCLTKFDSPTLNRFMRETCARNVLDSVSSVNAVSLEHPKPCSEICWDHGRVE